MVELFLLLNECFQIFLVLFVYVLILKTCRLNPAPPAPCFFLIFLRQVLLHCSVPRLGSDLSCSRLSLPDSLARPVDEHHQCLCGSSGHLELHSLRGKRLEDKFSHHQGFLASPGLWFELRVAGKAHSGVWLGDSADLHSHPSCVILNKLLYLSESVSPP